MYTLRGLYFKRQIFSLYLQRFSVYILNKHPKGFGAFGPYFGKCISILFPLLYKCVHGHLSADWFTCEMPWFILIHGVVVPQILGESQSLRVLERIVQETLTGWHTGTKSLLQRGSQELSFSSAHGCQILKQLPTLVVGFFQVCH